MSVRFSSRLQSVELSMIRQVMMKARNCINLGIGEPDFFAPEVIREEAHRILKEEKGRKQATRKWETIETQIGKNKTEEMRKVEKTEGV